MVSLLLFIIYLAFISLGLPDGLVGAGWPAMQLEFKVPVSYAGIITIIICASTIVSSLSTDYLTKKFGTGKVVAFSVLLTASALLGYSLSYDFLLLCLFAIPYGLGAGAIDASLNNYVALHFKSKHMSWLHCMWGIGAIIGPYAMSFALTNNKPWNDGFLYISLIQFVLVVFMFVSLPLWKKTSKIFEEETKYKPLSIKEIFKTKGVFVLMISFFCYCALEQVVMLWASSYLLGNNNIDEALATSLGSLFFIGMTLGRFLNGFISDKLKDKQLIRMGFVILALGLICLIINIHPYVTYAGLIIVGFGCAPIYPSVIHSTPIYFGEEKSQSLIGVQMACAYLGVLLMPPLFGIIADALSVTLMPYYLLLFFVVMLITHEILVKKVGK